MSLARTKSWNTTVISVLGQMKHSAQRRRGWKSEAEIHQTGTEPHNVKKCQSYFQQSDNCGDIWSVREEEKGLSSLETGDPTTQCRGVSHPSDSKGLWELAGGKIRGGKWAQTEPIQRAGSYFLYFSCNFHTDHGEPWKNGSIRLHPLSLLSSQVE